MGVFFLFCSHFSPIFLVLLINFHRNVSMLGLFFGLSIAMLCGRRACNPFTTNLYDSPINSPTKYLQDSNNKSHKTVLYCDYYRATFVRPFSLFFSSLATLSRNGLRLYRTRDRSYWAFHLCWYAATPICIRQKGNQTNDELSQAQKKCKAP